MAVRSQLRVNIITSLCSALLSMAVMGFAYRAYLHFMGYDGYGLWLVLSTVLTLAQLGNFGVSPALVKLVAEDHAADDAEGVYTYVNCGLLFLLASGAAIALAVLALSRPIVALFGIEGQNAPVACSLLPYIAALSIFALLSDAMNSVVAGLGRYDLVSYFQLAGQVLTVLIALLLFRMNCGIWSLLLANAANFLLLIVASLEAIRQITGSRSWFRLAWDRRRLRRVLNFGSWVFGATIVNVLLNPLNKLFVTRFAGIGAVPVYDIAFATSMKIRSLFESGFRSLAPAFSSLQAIGSEEVHATVASAERRGNTALRYATILYLILIAVCEPGLRLWLGVRFQPQFIDVFRLMLAGTYCGLWGLQPWYTLLGFGRSLYPFLAALLMASANVAFVVLWSQAYNGATLNVVALATGIGILAGTLYLRRQSARLQRELSVREIGVPCSAH